jgi:hypothetical protein
MPPKRPRETCFPTGRIKKIMQQDEVPVPTRSCSDGVYVCASHPCAFVRQLRFDLTPASRMPSSRASLGGQEVGKVAKAAPVLISKCLELLINDLVKSASKVCKSKNAATVNVNHLREAVAKESTFDFLQEVRRTLARRRPSPAPSRQGPRSRERARAMCACACGLCVCGDRG